MGAPSQVCLDYANLALEVVKTLAAILENTLCQLRSLQDLEHVKESGLPLTICCVSWLGNLILNVCSAPAPAVHRLALSKASSETSTMDSAPVPA